MLRPVLNRLGIGSQPGGTPIRRRRAPGAGSTPLSAMLPNFESHRAWFSQIAMPAAYTAVAGLSAWYALRRLRVPADVGEDQSLFGIAWDMLSTDNEAQATPSAGKTAVAWGNVRGGGAAIVVGINLPVAEGEWTTAPYFGPGLELASQGLISPGSQRPYLFDRHFPPGAFATASTVSCQRHDGMRSLMPAIFPVRANDSIDVALVLSGATVQSGAGADKVIVGEASTTLYVVKPYVRQDAD